MPITKSQKHDPWESGLNQNIQSLISPIQNPDTTMSQLSSSTNLLDSTIATEEPPTPIQTPPRPVPLTRSRTIRSPTSTLKHYQVTTLEERIQLHTMIQKAMASADQISAKLLDVIVPLGTITSSSSTTLSSLANYEISTFQEREEQRQCIRTALEIADECSSTLFDILLSLEEDNY